MISNIVNAMERVENRKHAKGTAAPHLCVLKEKIINNKRTYCRSNALSKLRDLNSIFNINLLCRYELGNNMNHEHINNVFSFLFNSYETQFAISFTARTVASQ